ncbi:MAG: hypothetical protein AB7S93_00635 [Xanthobacteraceae bacterium]
MLGATAAIESAVHSTGQKIDRPPWLISVMVPTIDDILEMLGSVLEALLRLISG